MSPEDHMNGTELPSTGVVKIYEYYRCRLSA
jgi:hypothetical protein